MKNQTTWLPFFSGFYETYYINDYNLDGEGDYIKQEYPFLTESQIETIVENTEVNYKKAHLDYAKAYTESFFDAFKDELKAIGITSIEFKEIDSPKYYNFINDNIEVDISFNEKLFKTKAKEYLLSDDGKEHIEDNYTSYNGFLSHHSSDAKEWLNEIFDYHKFGALLSALIAKEFNQDDDLDQFVYENIGFSLTEYILTDYDLEAKKLNPKEYKKHENFLCQAANSDTLFEKV